MFKGMDSLKTLDITGIDINNAKFLDFLFEGDSQLEKIIGFNFIKADNAISCDSMFSGCSNLKELDLSNFNTKNIESMPKMFYGCSSLKSLDVSKFEVVPPEAD